MGWFNTVRNQVLSGGRQALAGLREGGRAFAPKLTKRVEGWASKAQPVFDAIGGMTKTAADVGDAYASGDIAGGVKSGMQLGKQVYENAQRAGSAIKSAITGRKRKRKEGGFERRTARGGNPAEGAESFGPRISGDALKRLSRSANGG